ncbi:unnamed protein product, partial [Effrenium voratum]
ELKERVAEKSWTTIEVSSTALELQDRLSGSVVHVDDDIADGEKKTPSDDSKKASASGGESKEEKPSKGERDGTNAQAEGPESHNDYCDVIHYELEQDKGSHLPSHNLDAEFMKRVRKDGNSMFYG